jgi:hypothetical protein
LNSRPESDLESHVIGFRHTPTCCCGCQFVVGIDGKVIESYTPADVAIVRFARRICCQREQLVAYTLSEAGLSAPASAPSPPISEHASSPQLTLDGLASRSSSPISPRPSARSGKNCSSSARRRHSAIRSSSSVPTTAATVVSATSTRSAPSTASPSTPSSELTPPSSPPSRATGWVNRQFSRSRPSSSTFRLRRCRTT